MEHFMLLMEHSGVLLLEARKHPTEIYIYGKTEAERKYNSKGIYCITKGNNKIEHTKMTE